MRQPRTSKQYKYKYNFHTICCQQKQFSLFSRLQWCLFHMIFRGAPCRLTPQHNVCAESLWPLLSRRYKQAEATLLSSRVRISSKECLPHTTESAICPYRSPPTSCGMIASPASAKAWVEHLRWQASLSTTTGMYTVRTLQTVSLTGRGPDQRKELPT